MKKKKPLYLYVLSGALFLIVLVWYLYPRPMERLMTIPEDVSVNAMYWETGTSCLSQNWEAGSPEAQQVWELLHSTQYIHTPGLLLPLVDPDYLAGKINRQHGAVILVLEDGQEQNYLVAFFQEHMNYNGPSGMLKSYFVPLDRSINETLIEMVVHGTES